MLLDVVDCLRYFIEHFSLGDYLYLVCTSCNHIDKLYFRVHIEKYDSTSGKLFGRTCLD
jgi:hypothetical protein